MNRDRSDMQPPRLPPDTEAAGVHYALESELVLAGFNAMAPDPNRKLAWVNSVGIFFLLIGVAGSRPVSFTPKATPQEEQFKIEQIEPDAPTPEQSAEPQPDQASDQETAGAPTRVLASLPEPGIGFSVPTLGSIVGPVAIAKPPPLSPAMAVTTARIGPSVISVTGQVGNRPKPGYPPLAEQRRQQGTVTIRMTANAAGSIETIEIVKSSGFLVLDHSTVEFVKRHWTLPAGIGERVYETSIVYHLEAH